MKAISITKDANQIKNLKEERGKFFASEVYNPQFEYENPIDEKLLNIYGNPDARLFEYSKEIINNHLKKYGSMIDLPEIEGEFLERNEVDSEINRYLEDSEGCL